METVTVEPLNATRRRCAAYMTLAEVLEGEQLMRALWMLEERDQTADKMTFIGFVGVTAELLGINSNLITTLYSKLNQNLTLPDLELPDDPMPQMLEFRGIGNSTSKVNSSANIAATTQNSKKLANKIKGTPEMTVFVAFISCIVSETGFPKVAKYPFFKEVFKEEITRISLDKDSLEQMNLWLEALHIKVFKKNISAEKLSSIIHSLYVTLCEVFGPVKADELFNQAINMTCKLSAAKLFSPKNFL